MLSSCLCLWGMEQVTYTICNKHMYDQCVILNRSVDDIKIDDAQ